MRRRVAQVVIPIALVAWLSGIGIGMKMLWSYKTDPGVAATAPTGWPAESRLERATTTPTLVMLAHPKCPCTRASLTELSTLMDKLRGRVKAYVLFLRPDDVEEGWERTDTWDSASAIPGVTVVRDDGGVEAARFGAATSGQTVLYDASGKLVFSGGITGIRGHAGDNVGSRAIVSLTENGAADRETSLVFGCPLNDPADAPFFERSTLVR